MRVYPTFKPRKDIFYESEQDKRQSRKQDLRQKTGHVDNRKAARARSSRTQSRLHRDERLSAQGKKSVGQRQEFLQVTKMQGIRENALHKFL